MLLDITGGDFMGSFGGFYKGEKKKPKKDKTGKDIVTSSAPSFQMPEIVSKKKKDY
ncbi:MAG: hypothetical protein M1444_00245 [Patescibacteria group bacterium]|nr:hypothetical protein [Patescibacteria group bacterium]